MTLRWYGLFGTAGGVAAPFLIRISNLADVIWSNTPKSILDLFVSRIGRGITSVY